MFQCILCLKSFEDKLKTQEHVIPFSLGGNITLFEMCKTCNEHLGSKVDSPLINNFFIENKRRELKIYGKSGKLPNPFENMVSVESGKKYKWIFEDGKPKNIYSIPTAELEKLPDGSEALQISVDISDEGKIQGIIDKFLERKKKKGIKVEINSQIRQEIEQLAPEMKLSFEFNVLEYLRGILKIGYEFGYLCFGENYLKDPIANKIRKFLLKEKISFDDFKDLKVRGKIGLYNSIQSSSVIPFLEDENSIRVIVMPIDNAIFCEVSIFKIFLGGFEISEENFDNNIFDAKIVTIDPRQRLSTTCSFEDYIDKAINEGLLPPDFYI